MKPRAPRLTMAGLLLAVIAGGTPALAQKPGGILRVHAIDSPPSLSMLEEVDANPARAAMGIFNNLVMFNQHVKQNSMASIVPDLATGWSWSEDGRELTLPLRHGVKWHDGKPFTAADVKCTWDLLTGKGSEKLRLDPRKSWYGNLTEVTTNGDDAVTFHLNRPQPAFLSLLASGFSVVYPCHVSPAEMRRHPIGTGPFEFVEFKPNERVRLTRNPAYWKQGRPYLDGVEFEIIRDPATANLAFIAGKIDWTAMTLPLMKAVKSEAPDTICEVTPGGISRNLVINRDAAPFDNSEMRRAMALALDRKAFIDILSEGQGDIGGVMQPLPEGLWGMPPEVLKALPGYDPDVQKNRAEARQIMRKLGYGPEDRLALKISTRNIPPFRDPAVILIDQLKDVFVDAELEMVETALWYPKMYRKDFKIGLNLTGSGADPDQQLYENYACGAPRNYTGYCNPELEKLFERQSEEGDFDRRKKLVWEIERKLAEDGARPIIFYNRFAYCWRPAVKGWTMMNNSIVNNFRLEDVWLDN
ncbi:MAG: peptide ABC transporter substrate-binding protein [Alphaproteobacteria bacterium]|nr:peptide ABC transporter substrate-binding protein [Alphaproteobacteria bacterium]